MKYKFEGIGATGASIIMAGLGANPSTAWIATGFIGKVVFFVVKLFCMWLASLGLIVLNVGAEKLATINDEGKYDGSWDTAENAIKKIRDQGRDLTDEEIKAIDQPVIDAFRKFAGFGRVRERPDT